MKQPRLGSATRSAARPIRIVIVEPSPIYRAALRSVLESERDIHVVAETSDGQSVVKLLADVSPDVLLLVAREAGEAGLETLRGIQSAAGDVRTILLAGKIERSWMIGALRLGARGVIPAQSNAGLLFKCIRRVMAGECWVDRGTVTDLVQSLRENTPAARAEPGDGRLNLTPREREIVDRIATGCTNGDIAAQFGISQQTVKHHLTNIFAKVGVGNRLELALLVTRRPPEA